MYGKYEKLPVDNQPVDVHDGKKAVPHYFHKKCIEKVRKNECPLCRQPMEIRHGQNNDNELRPPVLRRRNYVGPQWQTDWAEKEADLMDTHGYIAQTRAQAQHGLVERNSACCSNCQKQSFCSRIFGCGQDLCHACDANLQPTTRLERCRKSYTPFRSWTMGGKRRKKKTRKKRKTRRKRRSTTLNLFMQSIPLSNSIIITHREITSCTNRF